MTAFPPPPIVNAIADNAGMVTTPWNLYFQSLTQLANTNNAATVTVADTTGATTYVGLFESTTGNLEPKTDANLTYDATTGTLAALNIIGASFEALSQVTTSTVTRGDDTNVKRVRYNLGTSDCLEFQQTHTTGHAFGTTINIRRVADYNGTATDGWFNSGLNVLTTVAAGTNTGLANELAITGAIRFNGGGYNVGIFGQAWRQSGTGWGWALIGDAQDQTGAESSSPLHGCELDCMANGVNTTYKNRLGLMIVSGMPSVGSTGIASQCWNGIALTATNADNTQGYYKHGLHVGHEESLGASYTRLTCDVGVKILADGTYGLWDAGSKTSGVLLQGTYSGPALVVDNTTGSNLPAVTGQIHIAGADSGSAVLQTDSFAGSGNLIFRRADNTAASPSAVQLDDGLGFIGARGYGATGYSSSNRANIKFGVAQNWTDFAHGTYLSFSTTALSTTTLAEAGRIDAGANWLAGYNGTTGVIATNATDRMLGFTTCAGAPSGTPTTYTGMARGLLDSTNNNWVVWNPVSAAWVTFSSSVTTTFLDSVFRVKDNGDSTKQLAFEVSGVSTATTRTLTVPNFDGTIATLAGVEALSNKTTISQTGAHTINASTGTAALPTPETGTLLQIGNANSTTSIIELDSFGAGNQFLGKRSAGTIASKSATTADSALVQLGGLGYDGAAYSGIQGSVQICAAALWSGSSYGTYIKFSVTPTGSTTIAEVARFNSAGLDMGANSIAMTGSLGATGSRLTKGWFTDLEVTNAIVGSITGNAATISSANEATDTTCFLTFITASGTQTLPLKNNTALTYNSNTGALGSTSFVGALTGNADSATQVKSVNEASDTTCFPLFISASGTQTLQPLNNTSFTFNASTGALGATSVALTAQSKINANTAALPAALTGALLQLGNVDGTITNLEIDSFAATGGIVFQRANNTNASPSALALDDAIGQITGRGYGASAYASAARVAYSMRAAEAWSNTVQGTYHRWETTAIGGTTTNEKMRLSDVGNLKIGGTASRGTTEGTNTLSLFNGTAPVGTLTNGCSLYVTTGEMRVMDAAGNATLLSPHAKSDNAWIYDSVDTKTGRHLRIDMEKMMKAVNDRFGWDFVHEFMEAA